MRPKLLVSIFNAEEARGAGIIDCEDPRVVRGMYAPHTATQIGYAVRRNEGGSTSKRLFSRNYLEADIVLCPIESLATSSEDRMASLPSPPDGLPPEEFFRGHLKLIEQVIAHACQRFRLRREDAEDFSSWVMIKLIENDYRKIREFKGTSTPKTYLTIVIINLLRDYINHLWGKWRSSEEAKRLGDVAVKLEELVVRDGYSFEMAVQLLRQNFNVEASREDLEALAARLPPRMKRSMEGEEVLKGVQAKGLNPEEILLEEERRESKRRLDAKLFRALKTLPPEDQLLVQLRIQFSVADIARSRRIEQKPLYRRLDKIYKALREALEREGVRRSEINQYLRSDDPLEPDER